MTAAVGAPPKAERQSLPSLGFDSEERKPMLQLFMGPPKPDWQVVTICTGFVVEVNCNGGGFRRVYRNGRIEAV